MKTYQINTSQDKFEKGLSVLKSSGGIVQGNRFSIRGIEGNFGFDNGVLTIIIKDKPWLVSWGIIEDKLDEFFS